MDYTTNYHMPQWVESDRIMMEDFNEAMAAIDGGIKAAQDTADGGAAAAENAQATADSALALAEENCYVKLWETTTSSTTSQISIDLSGVDLSTFSRLELGLYFSPVISEGSVQLRLNNDSRELYYSTTINAQPSSVLGLSGGGDIASGQAVLYPIMDYVACDCKSICRRGSVGSKYYSSSDSSGVAEVCNFEGITSLQIIGETHPGAHFILYGIKR